MAKEILAGSTNQTIDVFIQDSSATDGSGLTGLVYNTAGLTCYYRIGATGTPTALTLADLATIGTAHTDGGFKECEATYMGGEFRLDLSDVMVAAAGLLKIYLQGATNMAPCIVEVEVVAVNKYDAANYGLSTLSTLLSRITANVALASVCTETRLAELGAANLPADIDTLLTRVSANVALASVCTEARLAELAAANIPANIDAILADTNELQSDDIPGTLSAMDGKLDTIDGIVDSILVDTDATIPNQLDGMSGTTFNTATDSLEAIRDRGDAAWTTGAGGSSPTVEEIRAEIDSNSTQLAAIVEDTGTDIPTTLADIIADTNAILLDTNELQSDDVPGLISALNNISTADVNAQVLDVMNVDTHAEPGQGAPGATISIFGKINYLYKAWRNKKVQDATTYELYDDAGTTVDQKAADSDDGTDATVGEIISGP